MIKKLFTGNDTFFRKDEEGRDLFYPWGYPGEALHVDKKGQPEIKSFFYTFALFLGLSIVGVVLGHYKDFLSTDSLFYLGGLLGIVFPSLYIFAMFFLGRKAEWYFENEKNEPRKNILPVWLFIIFYQALPLWMIVSNKSSFNFFSAIYVVISLLYSFCITYFLAKLKKNKGYYLSQKRL